MTCSPGWPSGGGSGTPIADTLARLRDPRALSALQRFDRPDITEETVDNANKVYGVAGAGWAFQAYLDVHRAIVSLQIRQRLAAL
jgi:hypothetical protein